MITRGFKGTGLVFLFYFCFLKLAIADITCDNVVFTFKGFVEPHHVNSLLPEPQRPSDREFAERLYANLLSLLDPAKTIFLQNEIANFLAISAADAEREIKNKLFNPKAPDCSCFFKLHAVYLKAFARRQTMFSLDKTQTNDWRQEVISMSNDKELVSSGNWGTSIDDLAVNMKYVLAQTTAYERWLKNLDDDTAYELAVKKIRRLVNNCTYPRAETIMDLLFKALLEALDPHSTYLLDEDLREFQTITEPDYGGLGINIEETLAGIEIISINEAGPAAQTGLLKEHDVIVAIDGKDITNVTELTAATILRGAVGKPVNLMVLRGKEHLSVTVMRAKVQDTSVVIEKPSVIVHDGFRIGFVTVPEFYSGSANDLATALKSMAKIDGLIIDLRDNGGGLVDEAVAMAGLFFDATNEREAKVLVKTYGFDLLIDNNKPIPLEYTDPDIGSLFAGPVAVIVNSASASAAEIFAGIFQDLHRGIVMGTPHTFGKGSVQTMRPFSSTKLKFTTNYYYLPSGRSVQYQGILSDIVIASERERAIAEAKLKYASPHVPPLAGWMNENNLFYKNLPEIIAKLIATRDERHATSTDKSDTNDGIDTTQQEVMIMMTDWLDINRNIVIAESTNASQTIGKTSSANQLR